MRCASCYLPVRLDFARNALVCDHCDHAVTSEYIWARPRWRVLLDRITGIEERA